MLDPTETAELTPMECLVLLVARGGFELAQATLATCFVNISEVDYDLREWSRISHTGWATTEGILDEYEDHCASIWAFHMEHRQGFDIEWRDEIIEWEAMNRHQQMELQVGFSRPTPQYDKRDWVWEYTDLPDFLR
jgi:hypothetical protein